MYVVCTCQKSYIEKICNQIIYILYTLKCLWQKCKAYKLLMQLFTTFLFFFLFTINFQNSFRLLGARNIISFTEACWTNFREKETKQSYKNIIKNKMSITMYNKFAILEDTRNRSWNWYHCSLSYIHLKKKLRLAIQSHMTLSNQY